MAEKKIGTLIYRRNLSPILAIFRLVPDEGTVFPPYEAGQYIALRRENCRLTKKLVGPDGRFVYAPELDESGQQKRGPVSHSYSIASAPYETLLQRYLEFYVILHVDDRGQPGRLTESLFQMEAEADNTITFFYKITGDFTLEKRAAGYNNVVMVGTGSGLAPFASMIKQLHYDAAQGRRSDVRYTLFHGNRGYQELGYHEELTVIEASRRLDFVYVPTVSRPSKQDHENAGVGKGRANNLLRHVFDMPLKEEDDLKQLSAQGLDTARTKALLERTIHPVLPQHVAREQLPQRMNPQSTVILTCGNPQLMADIERIAGSQGIHFEMEEW
jgi:ferredoxin-NADP reductase